MSTWRSQILLMALFVSLFFTTKAAQAQDSPTIHFSPDPVTLILNKSQPEVVEVWIRNIEAVGAFDVEIIYDQTVARLDSWEHGEFFNMSEPGSCQREINNPGFFRLACAQLGFPAVSGDGIFIKLTFTPLKYGSTNLTFQKAIFSNIYFQSVYPEKMHSVINTTYDPGIIKPVNLNGTVSMQGRTNQSGVNIRLDGQVVGNSYSGTSSNASGNNYVFNNIAMDLYTVWTNTPAYLNVPVSMNKQIGLVAAATTLNPLHLVAGNAVWSDNEIDIHDLSLVSGNFGRTSFDSRADINGDGKVDTFDLALVAGNFGKTSEEEYAGWQP